VRKSAYELSQDVFHDENNLVSIHSVVSWCMTKKLRPIWDTF
jgi:hypothetical protein